MTFPYVEIDHDKVTVAGVVVPRPVSCNVIDWMNFWEYAREYDPNEDNSDTISELKERIKELENGQDI